MKKGNKGVWSGRWGRWRELGVGVITELKKVIVTYWALLPPRDFSGVCGDSTKVLRKGPSFPVCIRTQKDHIGYTPSPFERP